VKYRRTLREKKGKKHNSICSKPERGINGKGHKRKEAERNLTELGICQTGKGHKQKEAEKKEAKRNLA
jgi:hypothetical protein